MQTHIFSRSRGDKQQAARAVGLPEKLILIIGQHRGEMDEPRNFILEAARTIKTGKAMGRPHSVTALKALGLIAAACRRATCLRRWSKTPDCDPLPDFVALHDLATARLGPDRESGHPVTTLRDILTSAIRDLGGRAS